MTAFADRNDLGQEWDGTTVGVLNNKSTTGITLNNAVSETVILGGAVDTVTTGSTVVTMDTITGFQLVAKASDPLDVDVTRSDVLKIGVGFTTSNGAKMITTATTLNGALLEAAGLKVGGTDKENVVFHFGGDTYVYVDTSANGFDTTDKLVKLAGLINLDLLLDTGVIIV